MTPPQTEPTTQDRDRGLYPKYRITKANGRPTDPSASYFVLRLDGQALHAVACRAAAAVYADRIEPVLPQVAVDLRAQLAQLAQLAALDPSRSATAPS